MDNIVTYSREAVSNRLPLLLDYDPASISFINSQVESALDELNILATTTPINVQFLTHNKTDNFVNLKPVNDVQYLNKFFETVNSKLEDDGIFLGCFESKEQRKRRIFEKYPGIFAYLFYYLFDFVWKRVFPKVVGLRKIYFGLTKGHNRVITVPEVLGRLISCGFEICDFQEKDNRTYFCARKVDTPEFDEHPTYGPLISLDRVGLNGEQIRVYKMRTMHPYSEYLQQFIYEQNDLQEGGKFKDDFRITSWGKIMRKFWIDELPMLYNWIKGDLKLVGVRPLSKHYFELYPEQLQYRRLQYKPGLIPPFYADLPSTFDEILASEKKYMMEYEKHPFITDIKYFVISLYNIFIKRARSN